MSLILQHYAASYVDCLPRRETMKPPIGSAGMTSGTHSSGVLSDCRMDYLLGMQTSRLHVKPMSETKDG